MAGCYQPQIYAHKLILEDVFSEGQREFYHMKLQKFQSRASLWKEEIVTEHQVIHIPAKSGYVFLKPGIPCKLTPDAENTKLLFLKFKCCLKQQNSNGSVLIL